MAILKIVGRQGQVLKECSVPSASSMAYAVLHVADFLGVDPASGEFFLAEYPTMAPLPEEDLASSWDGRSVLFCRSDEP